MVASNQICPPSLISAKLVIVSVIHNPNALKIIIIQKNKESEVIAMTSDSMNCRFCYELYFTTIFVAELLPLVSVATTMWIPVPSEFVANVSPAATRACASAAPLAL